jgi:hypothetical protein
MKKLFVLLPLTLALAVSAQNAKPSAGVAARHTASAQPAATAETAATGQPETTDLALPQGTPVYMKLETPIATSANKAGDRFAGRVTQPVVLNSKTIIPVGAALEGKVTRADEMRRIKGTPTIELRPELITMPDGTRYSIIATVVDTSDTKELTVDEEGRIHGRGHDGGDWKETGLASGAGAGIGLLADGGKGMLIGAGVGATASVVHWLTKSKTAYLPAGTEIIMELSRPMALSSSSAGK